MEGVTKDLVCTEAKCGIGVAPGDVEGLKAAILELAGNKEKRLELGERGYKYVRENFSGRMLSEIYERVLNI